MEKINNEYLIHSALDAIHDGIVITDETSRIVYANPAYTRILGVRLDKILNRKVSEIEPTASLLTVLKTGKPILQERTRVDSLNMDIVSTITPIYKNGEIKGTVAIFKNVTEAMELTRALQRMEGLAHYLQEELEKTKELPHSFDEIVGRNHNFVESLTLAARAAASDTNVMIRGENGVGKEVIAKAIHAASNVCRGPMIRVNCSAIPENLLESELFGYEEGAFTGARKGGKVGKFELAQDGTLFLDEVGDMSLLMQSKLLRVIQEKEFERVGGTRPIKVNVRIISATNRNLEQMVREGIFREDLYYRLNVVPIFVPPLRERKDDLLLLIEHFLSQQKEKTGKAYHISEDVMQIFYNHDWPGNIRELQNVVEYSTVMCTGEVIQPEHLPPYFSAVKRDPQSVERILSANHQQQEQEDCDIPSPEQVPRLKDRVAEVERETIIMALRAARYNKTEAMKLLGISRKSFYRKLKELDIET
ncbi:MAG: sigma 54-interacting transcriptional regulator [Bacillaceae bacterium]|nr:sigma 54-interacting transcriptional regulator [Bacillaceae bacterium]